jgi:hypothetical protein
LVEKTQKNPAQVQRTGIFFFADSFRWQTPYFPNLSFWKTGLILKT